MIWSADHVTFLRGSSNSTRGDEVVVVTPSFDWRFKSTINKPHPSPRSRFTFESQSDCISKLCCDGCQHKFTVSFSWKFYHFLRLWSCTDSHITRVRLFRHSGLLFVLCVYPLKTRRKILFCITTKGKEAVEQLWVINLMTECLFFIKSCTVL